MGYTIWPDGFRGDAFQDVNRERDRQEHLKETGKFLFTCANPGISSEKKLSVLAEEFGEVSKEVVEEGITDDKYRQAKEPCMPPHREMYFNRRLRKELVQVAAVCIAWIESLDDQKQQLESMYSREQLSNSETK